MTETTKTQAEIDAEIAGANADAAVSAAAQPEAGMTPAQKAAATKAANKLAAQAAGALVLGVVSVIQKMRGDKGNATRAA